MAVVRPDGAVFWFFLRFVGLHVIEWQSHDVGKRLADLPFGHPVFRAELEDTWQFTIPILIVSTEYSETHTYPKFERSLRGYWVEIQLRYITTYSSDILGIRRVTERVIIHQDFGLVLFYLLSVPQLRHEHIDCTVFGLVAGSVENWDSKNDDFVPCVRSAGNLEDSLFAFQFSLAIPDEPRQPSLTQQPVYLQNGHAL
jgi:hypothetical protein